MVASTFRYVAAVGLILSVGVAGAAFQPEPKQPAPPQPAVGPEEKPAPDAEARRGRGERMTVGSAMGLIARSMDQLRGQIGDAAKKEENLKLINEVQRGAVHAKGLSLPKGVLEHAADDAAKAKLSESYRKDLITLLRKMLDIETEVAEGKLDAAKANLEEALKLGDLAHGRLAPSQE